MQKNGQRPFDTLAWGIAPGMRSQPNIDLATGQIHRTAWPAVYMAFGQTGPIDSPTWGVASGYGGKRPSAK
ncbi:hypothetical protein CA54_27900 [Symmachiella macrocystis]|uniref:Uncharacterized protein n=1 Tax=Symmachiella macrocystis TaxID=2527985 RepID=A0A5C6BPG2_9PLAN|nr:hypothetical protein CA54_27900 [Symmachiella macrocystis]